MSSSMKNAAAAAARPYRERAQLHGRQRLGLLEKHKDYSLRAKDYNEKKKKLASLRRKASEKNEDEFSFGMLSRSGPGTALSRGKRAWTGTVDGDRGNKALSIDTVRLLKTQDLGYIRTMRNVAAKEVAALEERYTLAGAQDAKTTNGRDEENTAAIKAKKIVFMDEVEERDIVIGNNQAESSGEEDTSGGGDGGDGDDGEARRKALNLERLQRKLQNARRKLETLANAEHELELQRARMAKTATYSGITKSGKRVKVRERKR